jgi:hypothetical protein
MAGEPRGAEMERTSKQGSDHFLPAGEAQLSLEAGASGAAGGLERAESVRAALAAHSGSILVLPSGRRIPIDTLLEHLAEQGSAREWGEEPCELYFAAKIEPWATPSSAPCWERMRGPLWHLWAPGTGGAPRRLIGLIIADQRASGDASAIEELFPEAEIVVSEPSSASQPPAADREPAGEIELSELVVEGEYHPRLAADDPAIRALTPPAGEGWQPRWWKLGSRPLWQYGWWR